MVSSAPIQGHVASADAHADARWLARIAEQQLVELEKQGRLAPRHGRAARFLRLSGQWFVRKGKELIQEHWDVALFDVLFGSVKAFGIYPALYFAGLTWTIPIMEYAPLNTQLWATGYVFARRSILSQLGKRRYGHSLNHMDEFRSEYLRIDPSDALRIHRFCLEDVDWTLRIRRSRIRSWLERRRTGSVATNVLLQSDLRRLIGDDTFILLANPLRSNAYYYEEILIQKILSVPRSRGRLLAALWPEPPLCDALSQRLYEEVGENLIPSYARVVEQGDSLVSTLRRNLDSGFSMTSMALRWINWSYQRTLYRRLAALEQLHYRLTSDLLDGRALEESEHLQSIRRSRAELKTWHERATRFGDRAKQLRSKSEAHELIDRAIQEARDVSLPVRLSRAARWLSPSRAGTS